MNLDYFVAPLIVSSISAALATVIVIIDKIVNNYGEVTIDINNKKKEIVLKGGTDLLRSLSEHDIFVPSACGGRGSCGACKVKVLSDVGPVLPTELPYLSKEELADKVRLACQIKVKANIQIEIPDQLFNIKQFTGVVDSIKDLTHDIKEVFVKLDESQLIDFYAGQYGQLEIPAYGDIKEPTQRAYSISSHPQIKDCLEFIIRLVPGGIVTTYVHNFLKEGEQVKIIGPFGDFEVRETNADMICVAGGSGMAPFKSILNDMLEKGKTGRNVWYFFGARTKADLFYLDEMKEINKKWPNFHFIPALSEPQPEEKWQGDTGLITDVLAEYLTNKISKENDKEGYLCGSPGMINACIEVMQKFGITEDKIYYDKFA